MLFPEYLFGCQHPHQVILATSASSSRESKASAALQAPHLPGAQTLLYEACIMHSLCIMVIFIPPNSALFPSPLLLCLSVFLTFFLIISFTSIVHRNIEEWLFIAATPLKKTFLFSPATIKCYQALQRDGHS